MKDNHLLAIKALAIVGVVFHHLGNRRLAEPSLDLVRALCALFSWCVLAFLAVSGWLHAQSEDHRNRAMLEYLYSRTSRLLLPFAALVALYAVLWQILQVTSPIALRDTLPRSFDAKIVVSLWPVHGQSVGEQLYFLPLLFIISVASHALYRLGGLAALCAAAAVLFLLGLIEFPRSANVGFLLQVGVWGGFSYLAGFLLFHLRESPGRYVLIAACALALLMVGGISGITKIVPLLLVAARKQLALGRVPLLPELGEASGTVYAYHTPFILQPLLILAGRQSEWQSQVLGVLAAAATAIAVCVFLHRSLQGTRFQALLM